MMKKLYACALLLLSLPGFAATIYWDGGSGDGLWNTAANWVGDVVPTSADDVVLDNSSAAGTYTVTLPNTLVTINTITIMPLTGNNITLVLPATNTQHPALTFNGTGYILTIGNGGVFKNTSGATSSTPVDVLNFPPSDSIRIYNGGKYIHNNVRSHAYIVDALSQLTATEKGIFEFDMLLSGNTISLSGRTYGTLQLSATTYGLPKSYNGAGTSDLTVRGDLNIGFNVTFSPTLNSNIKVGHDFLLSGDFNWQPASSGTTNRSFIMNGKGAYTGTLQYITGAGNITTGTNFRNFIIWDSAYAGLYKNFTLTQAADSFIVKPLAIFALTEFVNINGPGVFNNQANSRLIIGSADGLSNAGVTGNIRTSLRNFSKQASYMYGSSSPGITSTELPDTVKQLWIATYKDVTVTSNVTVTDTLVLFLGVFNTSSTAKIRLGKDAGIFDNKINAYGDINQGTPLSFVNGPMTITTNRTDTLHFPVGKISGADTLFAPVKLKPSNTTLKEYTVEYFAAQHTDAANVQMPPLDHVSTKEYWDISCNLSAVPDNEAKVSLSWRPSSQVGNGNPADSAAAMQDLVVAHYFNDGVNGLKWNIDGMPGATFTPRPNSTLSYGYITTDLYTGTFSPFTLGTLSPFNLLPVKLISFTARAEDRQIRLEWLIGEEVNIDRYILERSTDGRRFTPVLSRNAANTPGVHRYTAVDDNAVAGWYYYRLKLVGQRDKTRYSPIVKAWLGSNTAFLVYPNPAKDEIKIVLPASSNSEIEIVNSSGQVVKRVKTNQDSLTINIGPLNAGMYFISVRNDRQAIVQRFVKQ